MIPILECFCKFDFYIKVFDNQHVDTKTVGLYYIQKGKYSNGNKVSLRLFLWN